jgi:L-rhamnose mutarotase
MDLKVLRKDKVTEEMSFEYKEQDIAVLENIVKELKSKGATHFEIYAERDYDGYVENLEFTGYQIYFETPEQYEKRVKKEDEIREEKLKEGQELIKKHELAELKRLKEKYESK